MQLRHLMWRGARGSRDLSPDTRAKVLRAAEELHYHVNFLARGLSKQESRPLCILVSNLHKPYHAQLLDHITTALQKAQRISIIINVGDDPPAASGALEQTLNYRASATIVLSGAPPAHMVRRCVELGQSVILVNRADDLPDVRHISIDYETAMRTAVQMFMRAGCSNNCACLAGSAHPQPFGARGVLYAVSKRTWYHTANLARGLDNL
jgi:DNA-binding LacI/PurR family transcriptional regulator